MKKMFIACAMMLGALSLTSCKDTKFCYEVTTTYEILGFQKSEVSYVFATSNDLDAHIARIKETFSSKYSDVDVTYKRVSKSESDCR